MYLSYSILCIWYRIGWKINCRCNIFADTLRIQQPILYGRGTITEWLPIMRSWGIEPQIKQIFTMFAYNVEYIIQNQINEDVLRRLLQTVFTKFFEWFYRYHNKRFLYEDCFYFPTYFSYYINYPPFISLADAYGQYHYSKL